MFARLLMICVFAVFLHRALAQPTCTTLGQTPGSAFPVCGTSVFNQNNVPICGSTTVTTPCSAGTGIIYQERNPFWYQFTCFSAGTLGFVITPNNLNDDYDWQLFDITNHPASQVYTNDSLFVACNWSGEVGVTGASAAGGSLINCGGTGVPLFSSRSVLKVGHTYLLLVSHFTNSQSGYSLSFGGGTAVITDSTSPHIASAVASCDGSKVSIKLNKKMKCSSLVANGSDFSIVSTSSSITNATGITCSAGFDMDSIVVTMNPPLTAGTYILNVKNGTDGNTILDNCGVGIPVGDNVSFTVAPSQPPLMDSATAVGCAPDQVTLVFKAPVLCNSIAADGSDFIISGPTSVAVTSATVTCTGGNTTKVKLKLAGPIQTAGTYQVKAQIGSDGNTVTNSCGLQLLVGSNVSFNTVDTVNANFNYTVSPHCGGDTVSLSHNGNNGVNSWNWTFDGTGAVTTQNTIHIFSTGTHNVKLIVSNGVCSDTSSLSLTLSSPPGITTTVTQISATCGQNNGSASVAASGGTGTLTYLWIPGNFTTSSISNVPPGKYYVTVTDAIGCDKRDSIIVTAASVPQVTAITKKDITCFGSANGKATATVTGGLPPYTFSWSHGATTFSGNPLSNLDTGTYILTVTDARGCTATASIIVTQPSTLSHIVNTTTTTCGLNNGAATISESGGTLPYTYAWSPSGGAGPSATNLPAGTYLVNILDSNSCRDTVHVIIAPSSPVTANTTTTPVTCSNSNNGTATVIPTSIPPYTYLWSPGGGNTATITGLSAGTYAVTLTDGRGCTDTFQAHVLVSNPLNITIGNVNNVKCNGASTGSASVTATGSSPFTYTWSPIGGNAALAPNLPAGTYVVAVTDANNCTERDTVNITEPPGISTNVTHSSATCNLPNGTATVTATGGVSNFTYLWLPGNYTTNSISSLAANFYLVTVTDGNGCTKTDTTTIRAVPPPVVHITKTDIKCWGELTGSCTAIVNNGTLPFTYSWTHENNTLTGQTIQGLGIGKYVVRVIDSTGCKTSDSTTITEPTQLKIASFPSNTVCGLNNGNCKVLGVGGTVPYRYAWSTGATSDSTFNLAPGIYTSTITDANGCTATDAGIVVKSSAKLLATLGEQRSICPGTKIVLTPGPYTTYTWQDRSDSSALIIDQAGTYSVKVTDPLGCSTTAQVIIDDRCDDIVFPTAFTPNGDGKNDGFGPLGTLLSVTDYNLRVYNRWGQLMFTSTDPLQKWNGKVNTKPLGNGTYVWFAEYIFNKHPKKSQKGTILLIR